MDKTVLAILTARGGSKGLPGKNIRPFCGKPLIAWTIEQALCTHSISELFVSTDCQEIANISEQFGAVVPSLRPKHLAEDTSSSMDVASYTLELFEKQGKYFDYILLLEPTSPLRKIDDMEQIIQLALRNPDADGALGAGLNDQEHPLVAKSIAINGFITSYNKIEDLAYQRQQLDNAYFIYGGMYLLKTSVFKEQKTFYTNKILPYFVERWQNYEIDGLYDFICCEAIMNYRNEQNNM